MYKKSSLTNITASILVTFLLMSCEAKPQLDAAPIGEKQALDQLATAYNKTAEQLAMDPTDLPAISKKKFVQQVFFGAGYDYAKTVSALANVSSANANQYHKDMMDLLFLPHRGLTEADMEELYSEEELELINKIQQELS